MLEPERSVTAEKGNEGRPEREGKRMRSETAALKPKLNLLVWRLVTNNKS